MGKYFTLTRGLATQGLATQADYFLCAQLLQMDHEYSASLQTTISSITRVQTVMYTRKHCVKSHLSFLFVWIMNF